MDIGIVSVRYARALLKSATELRQEDAVYQDMQSLAAAYIDVPQLRTTADSPMLPRNKKHNLLLTACGKQPAELTKRFIDLVLQKGRERMMQFMAQSYITLYRQQKQIVRGHLITAAAVSKETEQKMQKMVESKVHGTVEFNTEVNPDIIGGFILEYDTYRLDASVQSQLRNILKTLKV